MTGTGREQKESTLYGWKEREAYRPEELIINKRKIKMVKTGGKMLVEVSCM